MQFKFEEDQKMLMYVMIMDAASAASGNNKQVAKHGRRLAKKIQFGCEVIHLKPSDLMVVQQLLKFTLEIANNRKVPEDETEEQSTIAKENLEVMIRLEDRLEGALLEAAKKA